MDQKTNEKPKTIVHIYKGCNVFFEVVVVCLLGYIAYLLYQISVLLSSGSF